MSKKIDKIEEEIKALTEEIEKAKEEKAESQGAYNTMMERLDKKFGIKTVKQAEKEVNRLVKEKKALQKKILDEFEELTENYEW